MKRDIKKYAMQGEKHMTDAYDLRTTEAYQLRLMAAEGVDGFWNAILTAYRCGFEAGRRQTKKQIRSAGA